VLIVALLVGLVVAWGVTPLARLLDPHVIDGYRERAQDLPLAPLLVIAVFVVGGLLAAPGTLMIGATVLLFGPARGAAYAFAGMLANGTLVYAIARYAARGPFDAWLAARSESTLDLVNRSLARRGFIAVAGLRLTPLPYTIQNVVAGTARISFGDFVLGTSIGLLPVITVLAGVAARFDAWIADPDWMQLGLLAGAGVAAVALIWLLKRRAARGRAVR